MTLLWRSVIHNMMVARSATVAVACGQEFRLADLVSGATCWCDRTFAAAWSLASADGGTQIHQCLGVVSETLSRQARFTGQPELSFNIAKPRPFQQPELSTQYPLDVAIENREGQFPGLRQNGSRCRASNTRQGQQGVDIARQFASMLFDADSGRPVQVARAAVVAQARPQREHAVRFGSGQCGQIRKGEHEAFEIRDHAADLGLLQHDFGQPDPVRAARMLPRQVVSARLIEPAQQGVSKGGQGSAQGRGQQRIHERGGVEFA